MLFVAWLNLVMQPCAMAFGSTNDCPRCPPSHHDEQTIQVVFGAPMAAGGSSSGEMPCSNAATNCTLLDELNYDGRTAKLDPSDLPDNTPDAIGPPRSLKWDREPAEYLGWHSTRGPPPRSGVPLNIDYCVYLK